MNILNVNFESKETILQSFDQIADKISKKILIKINDAFYRIVDLEFYTYSEVFPDPHTYKNKMQLENNKLYLHSSGVDLTFGDRVNHGGILLRSIIRLHDGAEKEDGFMKEQFVGPQTVATELFSNLYPLNSFEKNEISLIDIETYDWRANFYPPKIIIKAKRFGLTPKPMDKENFYSNLNIRYIIILPKFPKFKQAIKGIESLLDEEIRKGNISREDATEILGYKKKPV